METRLALLLCLLSSCLLAGVGGESGCSVGPLGMEEGRIPDDAITASSSYELKSVGPQNARIRQEVAGGAWCPKAQISLEVREYLEVDLGSEHLVTRTETQGRFGNGQGQEYAEAFLLEYWRESLQQWQVYKDVSGNKILVGNANTYLAVTQELELPFVARRVRFIPYSEHPRTVCMRVEIYGCPWTQGLLSYSAPRGDGALEDVSYDGTIEGGMMHGGLGQLTDGLFALQGQPLSEERGGRQRNGGAGDERLRRWVGWSNESQQSLQLIFHFHTPRRFTSLTLHAGRFNSESSRHSQTEVFSGAVVSFSTDGGESYHPSPVKYLPSLVPTRQADGQTAPAGSPSITIPLLGRLASALSLQLYFSSRWILLSEVTFLSVGTEEDNTFETEESWDEATQAPGGGLESNEVELMRRQLAPEGPHLTHARKELPPGTTSAGRGRNQAYMGLVTGTLALVVVLLSCTVLLMVRRGRNKVALLHKHASLSAKPINMKELKMSTPIIPSKIGGIGTSCPKVNNGTLKGFAPSGGGGAEESEDSETSSVYHEPYKLLASGKNEYGTLLDSSKEYHQQSSLPISKSADYVSGQCRSMDLGSVKTFQEEVKYSSPALYEVSPPGGLTGTLSSRPPLYEMSTAFTSSASSSVFPSASQPHHQEASYYAATDIIKRDRREQHLAPGTLTTMKLPDSTADDSPPVLEVSRHRLRVIEKIGEGHFGMLHLCETDGIPEHTGLTTYHKKQVIVKSLWRGSTESTKKEWYRERGWLARLRDPNLSRVVGCCSTGEPLCLLTEYLEFGELPSFLQLQASSPASQDNPALSYGCLMYMATQVASGMKYLESLDIPHRDLAARNCLVGKSYEIKVSDHAMFSSRYESDYYISDTKSKLPVRWMSWESLLLGLQSCKSDVWSFGVLLWEILTLCKERPYGELSPEQVVENCSRWYRGGQGRTLPRPPSCPREIYDLMTECWRREDYVMVFSETPEDAQAYSTCGVSEMSS